jgi:zinc/manganese transport system substrate-binding protein
MKAAFAGTPVTASEPVFGYMSGLLGLDMHNQTFQTAVMNNTEPSPADVAAFEDDLKGHKVRAMLYNSQADDEAVKRLVGIAKAAHVPVVGVSETEPAGTSYEQWMLGQLTELDKALASGRS